MNSTCPLVSVIIPAFNHGRYVADAINSALCQTYKNVEVIVVDNCSTDNTLEVLAHFNNPRVKVFQFDLHVIAAVRNFGARQARGAILAFLDADDVWFPNKLKIQLPYLADPRVSCVGTDLVTIGDTGYYKGRFFIGRKSMYRDYAFEEIACKNPVALSSAIVRAADFWEAGGFDECVDIKYIEDWELWLRIARMGCVRLLGAPLIAYRVFRNKNRDRRVTALAALRVLDKYRDLGNLSVPKGAYGNAYLEIGKACLMQGDNRAWRFLYKAAWQSVGFQNRVSSIGGLMICCVPHLIRRLLFKLYIRIPLVVQE